MKRKLLIVYVFIAFVLLCTNVYAALTMDLSLVPVSEKVKQGSELVVAVKLNNVSAPISSIEGYINVDENVLEPISESMIKGDKIEIKADGKKVSDLDYVFNPQNTGSDYDVVFNTKKENIENNDCFFIMDLRKDIKGNCDIMTLNFKVKDNATVSQATQAVKFKIASAVSASDLKDKVTDLSANLSFEVLDKNATVDEPKPDDNKTDDNKTDDNTNKPDDNKPDDNKPDDNKPDKKELKGEISYSTTSETTGPVTATLKVDDGVTVTNNSGKKTYTFSKNGYYIFEFADDDGNTGKARAEVSWIKSTTGNGNNNDDKKDDKKNENKNANNTNTNKNTNNNTNNNTNKNVNSNKNVNDTTVAGSKIPKAGAGMLILPVIVFIVLGYVSYIKYLKYKEV